jgi:hypothetical protein
MWLVVVDGLSYFSLIFSYFIFYPESSQSTKLSSSHKKNPNPSLEQSGPHHHHLIEN